MVVWGGRLAFKIVQDPVARMSSVQLDNQVSFSTDQ